MLIEYSADLSLWVLPLLAVCGAVAGFADTLAGGGGMLTLPALLITGLSPDAALATNKLQGCFGTVSAGCYFIRQGHLSLRRHMPEIACCAVGAILGSGAVQWFDKTWLNAVIPLLLLLVACIFIFMPQLGTLTRRARLPFAYFLTTLLLPIAFYDGFFGPGTGSFFLLALVGLRGYTLQQATIEAKLYNATTNLVSLMIFLIGGKVVWAAGLAMAGGQILGAHLASAMVIRKGHTLIRPMVIGISVTMSIYLAGRYALSLR